MAKAPDVSSGQVIASAHINQINDSIYTWQQDIDGNNKALTNVIHLQLNATSLPGSPTAGTTVVDSGAANVLKWFDGSGWKTVVAQGDTASLAQPLTVAGNAPAVIIRNTANKVSVVNHSWNNATQWVSGTGLPANTNVEYAIGEYTDGAFQGVRFLIFKGGNVVIGAGTDDGSNKLQVTGNTIVTGNFRVTGSLLMDTPFTSLSVSGTSPVFTSKNTDGTARTTGMFLNWSNASQWFAGTGSPSNTNTNFSFTEYTDGVYQGVRMMLFKGGRIAIGSTTDDNINTLQVAGPVKMTGVTHAYVEKSTDYTPTSADHTVNCIDAVIKNSHTASCTVNTTASQLMDDQLSIVLAQYECIKVQSTGSGWIII